MEAGSRSPTLNGLRVVLLDHEQPESWRCAPLAPIQCLAFVQASFFSLQSRHGALFVCSIPYHLHQKAKSHVLLHLPLQSGYSSCSFYLLFPAPSSPSILTWCLLTGHSISLILVLESTFSISLIWELCQLVHDSERTLHSQKLLLLLLTSHCNSESSSWRWPPILDWRAPWTSCATSRSSIRPLASPC